MFATFGAVVLLICTAILAGTGTDTAVLEAAHNTTVELTCINEASDPDISPPHWVMNGSVALTEDGYRSSRDEGSRGLIGTLTINGNNTCGTFSMYCILHDGRILHNTTLIVEGPLPSPENVHINESNSSLVIEWNPPYSAINTESSVIHVEPHITQYTVYIVDNYTGNYMERVNVTEKSFRRNIPNHHSCPVYHVTAWNSGGEGDMSVPLPGYLPRTPSSIAAEDVVIHREPGALDIHISVTDPCTARIPNFFLVTVMSTVGAVITTVQRPVTTTIHVELPQNVNECLIVNVSAVNSAGITPPTKIAVGCQTDDSTATTAIVITTTTTGSTTTSTDPGDQNQRDNSVIPIAIGSAVTGAMLIAAVLLLVLYKCWRNFHYFPVIPPEDNVHPQSPSLGGTPVLHLEERQSIDPTPLYPLPKVVDTTICTEPSSTMDSGIHTATITQTSWGTSSTRESTTGEQN